MKKMGKKGIRQWFANQKLGKKILYAFVLCAILPILAIQGFMMFVTSNNLKDKMDEIMVNQLMQVSERTSLTLDIYSNIVYQIYIDNQIIDSLSIMNDTEIAEKELASREIYSRLQQYGTAVEGIRSISLICRNGEQVSYDFERASSVESIWKDYQNPENIEPYRKAQDSSTMAITETMRYVIDDEEYRLFHLSKQIYDFEALGEGAIATVIMSIDESVLHTICSSGMDSSEEYSIHFITDGDNNVLTYPDSFYSGIRMNPEFTVEEFVFATGRLKGKDIAVNIFTDENLNWKFYNVYDKNYMLQEVTRTQVISAGVGVLVVSFAIALIFYIVRLIEKSVQTIIVGMQEVQKGNLDVGIPVESEDEMGMIAENFNTMTDKVQGLITEVTEVTRKQKEAEIRALEAQINPHFLYNTLDSINWMAIDKEEYEISKMLRNLGVILRYSINKSNQLVTIRELADWLEKYVSLQQMRFNDAFRFQMYVEEEILEEKIHKLLLQPFVENAIVHGFREMDGGGILRIDIMYSDDRSEMCIIVEDNGKGMSADQLRKFNDRALALEDDGKSIGIHNAFMRMDMYYGGRASWNLSSIPDMGTVVTLRIPVMEEAGNENIDRRG